MPIDLLQKINEMVAEQERSRTDVIVDLLKQALGVTTEKKNGSHETAILNQKLSELELEIEILKTTKDDVLRRLSEIGSQVKSLQKRAEHLEEVSERQNVLQDKTSIDSIEANALEKEITGQSVLLNKTTVSSENQTSLFQEEIKEGDIPPNAKQLSSSDLIQILKEEDSSWQTGKLQYYRENISKVGMWHTVGACRFKYSHADAGGKAGSRKQHYWWVVYPLTNDG